MLLKFTRASIQLFPALRRGCVFSDPPVSCFTRTIVDSARSASPDSGILKNHETQVELKQEIDALQTHLGITERSIEAEEAQKRPEQLRREKAYSELVANRKFFRKQLELLRELILPEQEEGYLTAAGGCRT